MSIVPKQQITNLYKFTRLRAVCAATARLLYLEVITRLFPYRPAYQARALTTARGEAEGCCRPRVYENSHVITSLSYERMYLNRQAKLFEIC